MYKQPNGKYADMGKYSANGRYNLTKEMYIEIEITQLKMRLENEFISADIMGNEPLPDIINNMIKGKKSIDQILKFLKDIGFDEPNVAIKNIPIEVHSTGFSNHDCCSYGLCPICGKSINSYKSTCYCGQKYILN